VIRISRCTSVFLASTLLTASACTSYMQSEPGDAGRVESVDVLGADGSSMTLSGVVTGNDTLRGKQAGNSSPVSIPFSDVIEIGVRTSDSRKTAAIVAVGGLTVLAGVIFFVYLQSDQRAF